MADHIHPRPDTHRPALLPALPHRADAAHRTPHISPTRREMMAELAGETLAKSVQLGLEYAPAPPFASGRPELASPEIVAAVRARMEPLAGGRREAVEAMAARLEAAV